MLEGAGDCGEGADEKEADGEEEAATEFSMKGRIVGPARQKVHSLADYDTFVIIHVKTMSISLFLVMIELAMQLNFKLARPR